MAFLQRLTRFLSKPAVDPAVASLYGTCVASARQVPFYQDLGVPDSVEGRFDLLLLHVILVMRRLENAAVKQSLFDLMFADMERNLREMGVGDMRIGKKMRPLILGFYGRSQAYEKALAEGDEALGDALARNLYGVASVPANQLQSMTSYVRRSISVLENQPVESIVAGKLVFAEPILEGDRL